MKIYRGMQERKNVKYTPYGTNRGVLQASSAHWSKLWGRRPTRATHKWLLVLC